MDTSVFMLHIRDVTLLQKTTNPLQGSLRAGLQQSSFVTYHIIPAVVLETLCILSPEPGLDSPGKTKTKPVLVLLLKKNFVNVKMNMIAKSFP